MQDGVPLERDQQLLGHASFATTQVYAHLQPPRAADVASALYDPRDANTATGKPKLRVLGS